MQLDSSIKCSTFIIGLKLLLFIIHQHSVVIINNIIEMHYVLLGYKISIRVYVQQRQHNVESATLLPSSSQSWFHYFLSSYLLRS